MVRGFRTWLKTVALVLVCAALGLGALTAVYALPADRAVAKLHDTRELLRAEGEYPSAVPWCYSVLDNYTDCWMLHIAIYNIKDEPLKLALENRFRMRGKKGDDAFAGLLQYNWRKIRDRYEGRYSRYWNGYLVWLRPLMQLTDYAGIRRVNLAFQLCLTAAVLLAMARRGRRSLMLPWLIVWGVLAPPALWRSMQYTSVFAVMSFAALGVVLTDRRERLWAVFALSGIATAFFDFLTYPLAALGVPLALAMAIHPEGSLKARLLRMIGWSALWCTGYAGMWAMKWVLATLLTDENVIRDALEQILYRSSATDALGAHVSLARTWARNLAVVGMNPFTVAGVVYGGFRAARTLRAGRLRRDDAILFGLLALYPFAWYALARNHSYIHCQYASKALAVTAMALLCMSGGTPQKEAASDVV